MQVCFSRIFDFLLSFSWVFHIFSFVFFLLRNINRFTLFFFNHFKVLLVHSPSFLENVSCRFSLSKIIRHFLSLSDSLYKSRIDLTVFFSLACLVQAFFKCFTSQSIHFFFLVSNVFYFYIQFVFYAVSFISCLHFFLFCRCHNKQLLNKAVNYKYEFSLLFNSSTTINKIKNSTLLFIQAFICRCIHYL